LSLAIGCITAIHKTKYVPSYSVTGSVTVCITQ